MKSVASAYTLIPLLALSGTLLNPASAQSTAEAIPEVPEATTPDGYQWGSFLVRPEAGVSLVYDSNIFATRTDEIDDTLILLTPSVDVTSQWEKHKLDFNAGAAAARYHGADSENYQDYWADADGRYDISKQTNVFGGVGYSREHEDRSSPDDLAGGEPTTYDSSRAHAGIAHSWSKVSARLGGTFENLDYKDVAPINHDDRDRDLTGIGARLSYRLSPRYVVFGQAVHDVRNYDQSLDDNGLDRDSDGNRFAAGFTGIFSNRLNGSAYLGHLNQSYDQPTFSDVSTLDFNGRLTFRATPKTNLTATLERTLEETTLDDASGYLYTAGTLEATHRIDARLRATAAVSAGKEDYQGIDREDDLYTADYETGEVLHGLKPDANAIYADEFGTWVTGTAPIRAAQGNVVALVAADAPVRPSRRDSDGQTVPGSMESLLGELSKRISRAEFAACTDEAIRIGVLGSPTYGVDGELFYGQDRLMFVERELERFVLAASFAAPGTRGRTSEGDAVAPDETAHVDADPVSRKSLGDLV